MHRCIVIIAFAFVFSSCVNKSQVELERSRATEETLSSSYGAILSSTNRNYHELEEKLSKPVSAQYAEIWWSRAQAIKEKTDGMIKYIESIIGAVETGAGLIEKNGKMVYKEDDEDVAKKIFTDKKTGEELYQELKRYKQDILDVDNRLRRQFGTTAVVITKDFDLDSNKQKNFTKTFFDGVLAVTAVSMLKQFENNVRMIENECIIYCNVNVSDNEDIISEGFSTLIGQSSNYLKAGDPIEISAGVGSFSAKSKPLITINGKTFQSSVTEGVASYKFKTSLKPGKYSIPVKIEYTDDWGKRQVITQKVEYTVVE